MYEHRSACGVVSSAGLSISRQRFGGQIRFDRATGKSTTFYTVYRGKAGIYHEDDNGLKSMFWQEVVEV